MWRHAASPSRLRPTRRTAYRSEWLPPSDSPVFSPTANLISLFRNFLHGLIHRGPLFIADHLVDRGIENPLFFHIVCLQQFQEPPLLFVTVRVLHLNLAMNSF